MSAWASVFAATIAAVIALITLIVNILITNKQLARLNTQTGEALIAAKAQADREDVARKSRSERMRLLLSASSIANSAAKDIVFSPEQADDAYRIGVVARSIGRISTFLEAVDAATSDSNLTEEDREQAEVLRTRIMVLFLKLDLDKIGPEYQQELKLKLDEFDESFQRFRDHVATSN
jgi:hypothetical protein